MLLQLPHDLLICIFTEFTDMDLKDLSAVDVAVCNHGLRVGHWLPLLPMLRLTESQRLPAPLLSSMLWLRHHGVQVKSIVVEMDNVASLDGTWRPIRFPTTAHLSFTEKNASTSSLGLRELLLMFSSITVLDLSDCLSLVDHQLLELLTVPLPQLRELDLRICKNITAAASVAAVRHFWQSLEVFCCDVLDDEAVDKLSRFRFPTSKLKSLGLGLDKVINADSILRFCAALPGLLELRFWTTNETPTLYVTNSFAEQITLSCRQLLLLHFQHNDPVDCFILPIIVANCVNIEEVQVRGSVVTFYNSANNGGHLCCDLSRTPFGFWEGIIADATLSALSSMSMLRLQRLGDDNRFILINHGWLYGLMANTFGGTHLLEVTISTGNTNDITPADFLNFLKQCCNLTVLSIRGFHHCDDVVDDDLLCLLPQMCPHITNLQLHSCAKHVSDQAVYVVLEGYRRNAVVCLEFSFCSLLTDAILDKLDSFPLLQRVNIQGTSVTKESAFDFLLGRRFGPLHYFAAGCLEEQHWIQEQLAAQGVRLPSVLLDCEW